MEPLHGPVLIPGKVLGSDATIIEAVISNRVRTRHNYGVHVGKHVRRRCCDRQNAHFVDIPGEAFTNPGIQRPDAMGLDRRDSDRVVHLELIDEQREFACGLVKRTGEVDPLVGLDCVCH